MEQRSSDAAMEDAQRLLNREECASGMELTSNYAAEKDAQIKPFDEESVGDTGQRSTYVALKNA